MPSRSSVPSIPGSTPGALKRRAFLRSEVPSSHHDDATSREPRRERGCGDGDAQREASSTTADERGRPPVGRCGHAVHLRSRSASHPSTASMLIRSCSRVAVADGDGLVGQGVVVDREAPRAGGLVHAGVSLADGLLGVVLHRPASPQVLVQFLGVSGMPSLFTSGKMAALMGASRGLKRHVHLWRFRIGVDASQSMASVAAREAGGRLDDVGEVAFETSKYWSFLPLNSWCRRRSSRRGARQASSSPKPQAEGEPVFDVEGAAPLLARSGPVRRRRLAHQHVVAGEAEFLGSAGARRTELEPLFGIVSVAEPLDLHLLELTGPEDEVPGGCGRCGRPCRPGDAEGDLHPHGVDHVVEVQEDSLGGRRSEVEGAHRPARLDERRS